MKYDFSLVHCTQSHGISLRGGGVCTAVGSNRTLQCSCSHFWDKASAAVSDCSEGDVSQHRGSERVGGVSFHRRRRRLHSGKQVCVFLMWHLARDAAAAYLNYSSLSCRRWRVVCKHSPLLPVAQRHSTTRHYPHNRQKHYGKGSKQPGEYWLFFLLTNKRGDLA